MRLREVPPTAGLPLRWRDFVSAPASSLSDGLAALLNVPEVQIECSGTAALIVALTTLKEISNRRSVVIPAYTCPLVAAAINHCGLTVVPCDVRKEHFDFSREALETLVGDDTLAVIPTHLGGRVAELDAVSELARHRGAWIIEDAAQSLGALWRGQPAGTIGDIGFYSLAVGKGLTLYEGGVLVTRDAALRRRLRETNSRIVPRRLVWELRRIIQLAGYTALYRPHGLRWAYGMPLRNALRRGNLIEAVGDDVPEQIPVHRVSTLRQRVGANALPRLHEFLERTTAQAAKRSETLRAIGDPEGSRGTWPFYMVMMPSEKARDAALQALWTEGVGVSRLFIDAIADLPNARDFAARMLTVSNSPWLREEEFARIASVIAADGERASRPQSASVSLVDRGSS